MKKMTERQLAKIMPLGKEVEFGAIIAALGCTANESEKRVVAAYLRQHKDAGYLRFRKRSNRAGLWIRTRAPKREPRKKKSPFAFDVERVSVGGSTSGHYGASDDKPKTISLPKMPALSSIGFEA